MRSKLLLLVYLALISSHLVLSGCGKTCGPGYGLVNDMCKRVVQDGAAGAAGAAESVSGNTEEASGPVAKRTDAAGEAGSSSTSSGSQSQPVGGQQGSAGTSDDAGAAPSPSMSSSTSDEPAGACAGHPGESVCDGTTMLTCDDAGSALATEPCTSESFCQIGLAAGACAVCNPGTFQCDGARLDVCTDAGQYVAMEECATPELCKADAGLCTDMVCAPGAVTCSSDGATLNTCNTDGSAFADQMDCQGKGCNSSQMSCNTCKPGEKTCSGSSVETCNADGQTTAMSPCTVTNECQVPSCVDGRCGRETMPTGASCSRGKCDATGRCVACLVDTDCPAGNACTAPACIAGACLPQNVPAGMECGTNMECDGRGRCVEQDPCDDDIFDPTMEECDPTSPEWINSNGACDANCKLTSKAYQACAAGGTPCWQGAPAGWMCSMVGSCTRICTSGEKCAPTGSCVRDNHQPSQSLCITTSCSAANGTVRQWFGREGCFEPGPQGDRCEGAIRAQEMCGWVSADPVSRVLWCPNENSGEWCCPPGVPQGDSRCVKED